MIPLFQQQNYWRSWAFFAMWISHWVYLWLKMWVGSWYLISFHVELIKYCHYISERHQVYLCCHPKAVSFHSFLHKCQLNRIPRLSLGRSFCHPWTLLILIIFYGRTLLIEHLSVCLFPPFLSIYLNLSLITLNYSPYIPKQNVWKRQLVVIQFKHMFLLGYLYTLIFRQGSINKDYLSYTLR